MRSETAHRARHARSPSVRSRCRVAGRICADNVTRVLRAAGLLLVLSCGDTPTAPASAGEMDAGQWKTWVLASGAELTVAAPPAENSAQARQELDDIVAAQAGRTPP